MSVYEHLTYDHRAVVRRTTDLLTDDHYLDHRHRVIHIVRDVQANLRGNLPRHLQEVGDLLLNTNLGHHEPISPDQIHQSSAMRKELTR
jgi:hypothetical protein